MSSRFGAAAPAQTNGGRRARLPRPCSPACGSSARASGRSQPRPAPSCGARALARETSSRLPTCGCATASASGCSKPRPWLQPLASALKPAAPSCTRLAACTLMTRARDPATQASGRHTRGCSASASGCSKPSESPWLQSLAHAPQRAAPSCARAQLRPHPPPRGARATRNLRPRAASRAAHRREPQGVGGRERTSRLIAPRGGPGPPPLRGGSSGEFGGQPERRGGDLQPFLAVPAPRTTPSLRCQHSLL